MRQTYLIFLAILLVIAGLLVANVRINTTNNLAVLSDGIVLENLPINYCPKQAEIYQSGRANSSTIVVVRDCRNIAFNQLNLSNDQQIIIKLPKALAFTVNYYTGTNRYLVGLRVGDVNGDNIIDEQDEELVTSNLFNSNDVADVDMDGEITAHDLSLTRSNRAVGVPRGDDQEWRL